MDLENDNGSQEKCLQHMPCGEKAKTRIALDEPALIAETDNHHHHHRHSQNVSPRYGTDENKAEMNDTPHSTKPQARAPPNPRSRRQENEMSTKKTQPARGDWTLPRKARRTSAPHKTRRYRHCHRSVPSTLLERTVHMYLSICAVSIAIRHGKTSCRDGTKTVPGTRANCREAGRCNQLSPSRSICQRSRESLDSIIDPSIPPCETTKKSIQT